jgi:hypothetical protein
MHFKFSCDALYFRHAKLHFEVLHKMLNNLLKLLGNKSPELSTTYNSTLHCAVFADMRETMLLFF